MKTPQDFELPPEAQRLLASQRHDVAPPDGARQRVRSRVALTVGAAALGGAAVGGGSHAALAAGASKTSTGVGLAVKVSVALVVVVGALLGGNTWLRSGKEAPAGAAPTPADTIPAAMRAEPAVVMSAQAEQEDPAPAMAAQDPAVAPVPQAAAPKQRRRAQRQTPAEAPGLEAENQLMRTAQAYLGAGHAQQAWDVLLLHKQRHANGQLKEERQALSVMVLVKLGRMKEARAAARRFAAQAPDSVLRPAVEAALDQAP